MNATILPGPGAKSRAPRTREGDGHSIQSVDRALFLLETIAEAGGEATLTDLANRTGLNISTCHHLLATLIQRGFAAKVPGRRLYALGRAHHLSRPCLPAGRSAAPGAALSRNRQSGDRRDGASRRVAGRQRRHAVRARGAPRRARRYRQDRQGRGAARHVCRQGHHGLAAGRRDPAHPRERHEAFHRQDDHRAACLARVAADRPPQRLCASIAKNICRA